MTYSSRFEKDILICLKILVSKKNYKKILKQSDYNFTNCFVRGMVSKLSRSKEFCRFVLHLYSKKLLKRYKFVSLEEIEVAQIFLKKYKSKTLLILKNKFIYNFKTYLLRIIIKTLLFFFDNQEKKPLKNLNNVFFYVVKQNTTVNKLCEIIYPKKKKIFTKFLIFKKFTHFFTKQKNFFIKTYLDNDYLEIHKLWLNFFILQKSITKIKPKTIVSFEGDAWDHDMLYLLSKKIGFRSINIQRATDLESYQKAGFHNMEQTKLLVWGKHYKNIYKKICPNQKDINVVGDASLLKKKKSFKNKIGILLQNKNYKLYPHLDNEFKELINWLCATFKKEIIIRPHPTDKRDYYDLKKMKFLDEVIIHEPKKFMIGETLNECSIVFTQFSSTVIEAASLGVIPVLFGKGLRFEKKVQDLKNYNPPLILSSIKQAKKSIIILKKDHKKRRFLSKKIRNKFKNHINYFGKDAVNRIKSEINLKI